MRKFTALAWGVAVLLTLLPASLARAQDREQLQLLAEIRMLQEQLGRLEVMVSRLSERLDGSQRQVEASAAEVGRISADKGLARAEQEQVIGEIRQRLDAASAQDLRLSQDVSALGGGIRLILDRVNEITTRLPAPDVPASDGTAPPPLAPLVLPPSATALHDAAQGDLLSGRYDLAIEGFRELIASVPNAPDAANAQFAIGEAFTRSGRCTEAVPEYRKVIANYGSSDRAPDAYLMLSSCLGTMGEVAEAGQMIDALLARFPNSPAAARARSGN